MSTTHPTTPLVVKELHTDYIGAIVVIEVSTKDVLDRTLVGVLRGYRIESNGIVQVTMDGITPDDPASVIQHTGGTSFRIVRTVATATDQILQEIEGAARR